MLAVDKFGNHAGIEGARPIEGQHRGYIFEVRGFEVTYHLLHAGGFELEDPFKFTSPQQGIGGLVFEGQSVGVDSLLACILDQLNGALNHGQVTQS